MTLPDPLLGFWLAWSSLGSEFRRTPWGTVVTDRRFPLVWDANHAGVFEHHAAVTAGEIRGELRSALRDAGAVYEHVEFWDPPGRCPALKALLADAERQGGDVVMVYEGTPRLEPPGDVEVREIDQPDEEFWARYRASRQMFGERLSADVVEQMDRRDREVMLPAGLRLFTAVVGGKLAGLANLLSLEGVGYIDNLVTFPRYRRRGVATAAVSRLVETSRARGDRVVHLLADEGGPPQRLYERLGFRVRARIQSATRRLPRPGRGVDSP